NPKTGGNTSPTPSQLVGEHNPVQHVTCPQQSQALPIHQPPPGRLTTMRLHVLALPFALTVVLSAPLSQQAQQPQPAPQHPTSTDTAHLPQTKPLLGTPEDPKLPLTSVDAVLMLKVYHEIANPKPVLQSIHTALRHGGRFGIIDRNGKGDDHGLAEKTLRTE